MRRHTLDAKEDRLQARRPKAESVDVPFLILVLILLSLGLIMLYSASFAQSQYDTGYTSTTRYLEKQGACALIGLGASVASLLIFGKDNFLIPAMLIIALTLCLYKEDTAND